MVPNDTLLEEATREEIDEKLEACGCLRFHSSEKNLSTANYLGGK